MPKRQTGWWRQFAKQPKSNEEPKTEKTKQVSSSKQDTTISKYLRNPDIKKFSFIVV